MNNAEKNIPTSISPWLSVRDSRKAVDFYKSALGAAEVFRLEDPGGIVARLSVDGAEFWVSDESPTHGNYSPMSLNGSTVRIILVVSDPETLFKQALDAGATQIYPVSEEHGWKVGRLADPFGHSWEICRPLSE
jgi:PhnB protein